MKKGEKFENYIYCRHQYYEYLVYCHIQLQKGFEKEA